MKRINIDHKLMVYPQRLYILDAVFVWQMNEKVKQEVLKIQEESMQVLRMETGFSRKRCLEILRGSRSLDDFKVREGYNNERRNVNEL